MAIKELFIFFNNYKGGYKGYQNNFNLGNISQLNLNVSVSDDSELLRHWAELADTKIN